MAILSNFLDCVGISFGIAAKSGTTDGIIGAIPFDFLKVFPIWHRSCGIAPATGGKAPAQVTLPMLALPGY